MTGSWYAWEDEAGPIAGGASRMLAGESPVHPIVTGHETKAAPPATSPADEMLRETRIRLAFLQRHATRLAETHEGCVYLRLLSDTAEQAVAYAESHCGAL